MQCSNVHSNETGNLHTHVRCSENNDHAHVHINATSKAHRDVHAHMRSNVRIAMRTPMHLMAPPRRGRTSINCVAADRSTFHDKDTNAVHAAHHFEAMVQCKRPCNFQKDKTCGMRTKEDRGAWRGRQLGVEGRQAHTHLFYAVSRVVVSVLPLREFEGA